jgi:hypothetical protein
VSEPTPAIDLLSAQKDNEPAADLDIWDAGEDDAPIEPRGWLLGNVFCRSYISSILADGGVGKTALRIAQCLSLASGRKLTGERVFQRCRVLFVSLEDDADELRRRVRAAMQHHSVKNDEVRGWLFLTAPGGKSGKLMRPDESGRAVTGGLANALEAAIERHGIDIVIVDPFVKAHGLDENSNTAVDGVMQLLSDMAIKYKIAIDMPHHISKAGGDAGNANRGRGASAMKDAARLVYTLTAMSTEEATTYGVEEPERRRLVRMDSAKVNIAPPPDTAHWFKLIGVPLGNSTEMYPNGDEVQTVEIWTPPDAWADLDTPLLNRILDDIDAGMGKGIRYSGAASSKDRAAWHVVLKHAPDKREPDARRIIKAWMASGLLVEEDYDDPSQRKSRKGLSVNATKRPGKELN